jgi:hypothetical protein
MEAMALLRRSAVEEMAMVDMREGTELSLGLLLDLFDSSPMIIRRGRVMSILVLGPGWTLINVIRLDQSLKMGLQILES